MDFDEWLYEDACRHLSFDDDEDPFRSIEIWSFDVSFGWQIANTHSAKMPADGLAGCTRRPFKER